MTLSPIEQGNNRYCGPAVVAGLFNINTDEAAAEFNRLRQRKPNHVVTTVTVDEILKILKTRFDIKRVLMPISGSLFFTLSAMRLPVGIYVAYVTRHVVALEVDDKGQIYFLDNRTKKPVNAAAWWN